MKHKKLRLFFIILFLLPICFVFISCNKTKNEQNMGEFICDLSPENIKKTNFVLGEDDLIPKQNINGLNSNFVYDLDQSLAKDRCFIEQDRNNDVTRELGKIDSYYWDNTHFGCKWRYDYPETIRKNISWFDFVLNPAMKRKLKKIENLKNFVDFYWVYKDFGKKNNLIVKKDNDFLSPENCFFARKKKIVKDIEKSDMIDFKFECTEKHINKLNESSGFCGVILKFKHRNKAHSIFIKFCEINCFNLIYNFVHETAEFYQNLSKLNYCFAIEEIANDKFEDFAKKIIENDSNLPQRYAHEGEENHYFFKTIKNNENELHASFIKFDDVANAGKDNTYLFQYVRELTIYLNKKISTPRSNNKFLHTQYFLGDYLMLLNTNGKKIYNSQLYDGKIKNYHASIVNTYNPSICKNVPILNNSIKLSNCDDPPKKCTYKCIFDPLILQICYVLKNLDEKELDYFFEYKDKNSIYRTKTINRDCCTKGNDGFHHIKFGLKVFGCDLYWQELTIKFIDFDDKF